MPPSETWWPSLNEVIYPTCVPPRPERPKTVTNVESIDQIQELILEESQISAKSITEQLDILRDPVGFIIHEDLNTRKVSATWAPKCLNAEQNRLRCHSSEQIWIFFSTRFK